MTGYHASAASLTSESMSINKFALGMAVPVAFKHAGATAAHVVPVTFNSEVAWGPLWGCKPVTRGGEKRNVLNLRRLFFILIDCSNDAAGTILSKRNAGWNGR